MVLCAEQNLPGERETLLFLLGRSGGLHLHAKLYAEPFFLKQQLDEASSFIIDATICQHVRCPTTI